MNTVWKKIQIFIASMSRLTSASVWLIIYTPEILVSWDIVTHAAATAFLFLGLCEPRNNRLNVTHKYHWLLNMNFQLRCSLCDPLKLTEDKHNTLQVCTWLGVPHLAPLDSCSFRASQMKSKWKRNQNNWLSLESSRHESTRLDSTGLCQCQQPYVLHSEQRLPRAWNGGQTNYRLQPWITFPAALLPIFVPCFYNVLYQIPFLLKHKLCTRSKYFLIWPSSGSGG